MPQKIDALAEAIESKKYELMEKILKISLEYQDILSKQEVIPNYKLNLEKLSSKKESLLCKTVISKDYKACLLLLQHGASITGTQTFTYTTYSYSGRTSYPTSHELNPSALAYALQDADLIFVKLLLMNDNHVSSDNIEKAINLSEWHNSTQEAIKQRPDYAKLNQLLISFKYIKCGLTAFRLPAEQKELTVNKISEKTAFALSMFMQALHADTEFTLECLEAMIKELNCISQGIPPESRLTLLDTTKTLFSLRALVNAVTCFFNTLYARNLLDSKISSKLDQVLADLLALQYNLKQSEGLESMCPFGEKEIAREFVLFHMKDDDLKKTIQAMSNIALNKKEGSKNELSSSPITVFFSQSADLAKDETKQTLEEKQSQFSPPPPS